MEKEMENINHPAYYGGDTIFECVKVLRAWLTPEAELFDNFTYLDGTLCGIEEATE